MARTLLVPSSSDRWISSFVFLAMAAVGQTHHCYISLIGNVGFLPCQSESHALLSKSQRVLLYNIRAQLRACVRVACCCPKARKQIMSSTCCRYNMQWTASGCLTNLVVSFFLSSSFSLWAFSLSPMYPVMSPEIRFATHLSTYCPHCLWRRPSRGQTNTQFLSLCIVELVP